MPSFDTVSEVDLHEITNAVTQAAREISTRFDLKGTGALIEEADGEVLLKADNEFQLTQVLDVLRGKMAKRGVDAGALEPGEVESNVSEARQTVKLLQGIDTVTAKQVVKLIKQSKIKVQASIQGDSVRINGKKRDELQEVIQKVKDQNYDMPLQFVNFRD